MRNLLAILAVLFMAGCLETPIYMAIPDHPPAVPIEVQPDKMASFAFEKAVVTLKTGTAIANYPNDIKSETHGIYCNEKLLNALTLDWDGGKTNMVGWDGEIGRIFHDTMKARNFKVLGNPSDLFESRIKREAADFLVAAEITQIKGNICEGSVKVNYGNGTIFESLNKYAGEFYIDVIWSVYDPAAKKKIGEFKTYGYAKRTKPVANGITAVFNDAFEDAILHLAGTQGFVDMLASTDKEKNRQEEMAKYEKQTISGVEKSRVSASEMATALTRATVTIRAGHGHGTGFLISREGYILTAAHVAGDAKKMTVKFDNGLELPAEVLRTNSFRDAALLKVEVSGLTPLALETADLPKVLDEVYAVGSPLKEELKTTMTRGVVSAVGERDTKSGLTFIQADAGISGGNSGGPLVDRYGNVVGIAVSGYGVEQMNAGLNFFVPIVDALKYLNLEVTKGEEAK